MSVLFRLLLMLVSFGTVAFFLRKIRKAKVQIQDVLFWLMFSAILLVLCIVPELLSYCSRILGVQSPANLLFLIIIFLLMIHQFSLTLKVSMLEKKLYQLGRKTALDEAEEKKKES
ncbi:MAG: DUF2304 domain-containing protein [Ruminococcaceae bacterium]|nr:DUF2304 domain-containing protein [Oscillospiraceae bacterium]